MEFILKEGASSFKNKIGFQYDCQHTSSNLLFSMICCQCALFYSFSYLIKLLVIFTAKSYGSTLITFLSICANKSATE